MLERRVSSLLRLLFVLQGRSLNVFMCHMSAALVIPLAGAGEFGICSHAYPFWKIDTDFTVHCCFIVSHYPVIANSQVVPF